MYVTFGYFCIFSRALQIEIFKPQDMIKSYMHISICIQATPRGGALFMARFFFFFIIMFFFTLTLFSCFISVFFFFFVFFFF